jgi:deoxyribonuclease-4
MKVGCHFSSSGGYLAMAQTAVSIGANVFQFFTRNPRGGLAKPIDKNDVAAFLEYSKVHGIGPILAHAPYTMNAAGAEERVRQFAEMIMKDDLLRLEYTPGALYNFHPGSHVGQGMDAGIELISSMLARVFTDVDNQIGKPHSTMVLLETMAGKGSEIGGKFEELKAIIDSTADKLGVDSSSLPLGVCLDTCHVWDGGYDVSGNLDAVLSDFDKIVGLQRLKAVHLNDSMNVLASHKDRHEKIGSGKLGLEAVRRIVRHDLLKELPFYLETPCDLQGYKNEIALLKELAE